MTKTRNDRQATKATRWGRMICAALMALYLGASLSACGKRGNPEPPPGAEKSDYPRHYPAPNSY